MIMEPIRVVAAVRKWNGFYWMVRRTDDGGNPSAEGYWEYPGGKVEEGESLEHALWREMREEFGVGCMRIGPLLDTIITEAPWNDKLYEVNFFAVDFFVDPTLRVHDAEAWVSPEKTVNFKCLPSGEVFNAGLRLGAYE